MIENGFILHEVTKEDIPDKVIFQWRLKKKKWESKSSGKDHCKKSTIFKTLKLKILKTEHWLYILMSPQKSTPLDKTMPAHHWNGRME